ncbi:MAG TPA: hypothetical protein VK585_03430 [Jiangellaceae bacterium]|nr:hypothetical protein [Jiangellaceae bacterium]
MGYDRELADRIRELVAGAEGVAEQHVDTAAVAAAGQLEQWVARGVTYARSLPAKRKGPRRRTTATG